MPRPRVSKGRVINKSFYIFCEGKKTEPYYFKRLIASLSFPLKLARVQCVDSEHTDLVGLVRDAMSHRNQTGSPDDEYWIVVDKDGYPKHPEGFDTARANKIKIAFSSICFEFWLVLHCIYRTPAKECCRDLIRDILADYIPDYEKNRADIFDLVSCENGLAKAIRNARRFRADHGNESIPVYKRNPYTDVDILVVSLLEFRKQIAQRYLERNGQRIQEINDLLDSI
jgi:hypothetical protein